MLVLQKMTKKPITVKTDMSVSDALDLMHQKKVHRLPVIHVGSWLASSRREIFYTHPLPLRPH
jgi:predicted transcriptional regulator